MCDRNTENLRHNHQNQTHSFLSFNQAGVKTSPQSRSAIAQGYLLIAHKQTSILVYLLQQEESQKTLREWSSNLSRLTAQVQSNYLTSCMVEWQ